MEKTMNDPSTLEPPRKRLLREHRRFRSWRQVARHHGLNVAYVYQYAVKGKVPSNRQVQRQLGIHHYHKRTLADIDRDMKLPISDMPVDSLRAAFMFREVMP